jgi:hypothetical protein
VARKGERSGRCAVCRSEHRYRVELMLVAGTSKRAVGQKFSLHPDAVARHFRLHVPDDRRAALIAGPLKFQELAQKATDEGLALIDYLALIRCTLLAQFTAASDAGDRNGTAVVAGRLLDCLRMTATLTGEISRTSATINNNTLILASPLMQDLQLMLIRQLQPFPDARAAVLAGLEELSARALSQTAPVASPGLLLEALPHG